MTLTIIPIQGIGEIGPGDEIADVVATAAAAQETPLADGDCLVITQKIVSKAEGRLVELEPDDARGAHVRSSSRRPCACSDGGRSPHHRDGARVRVRERGRRPLERARGRAALLPVDPDRSARHVRDALRARHRVEVAVIVSDTFGRAWRNGLTDVAIGVAGIAGVVDLRGALDAGGRELQVTEVAVADEIAGAAELVMGKATGIPAAIVRGIDAAWIREATARELVRSPQDDLFR